jgi:hypothetical protein
MTETLMRLALGLATALVALSGQTNPFDDVSLLRRAIAPLGPTLGWKEISPRSGGGFFGTYLRRLRTSNFVESNVQYDIEGKKSNRVDQVSFSGFVTAPEDMAMVRMTISSFASQWFKANGKVIPTALVTALKSQNQFMATDSNLVIDFRVEKCPGTPINCSSMRLTLKHNPA